MRPLSTRKRFLRRVTLGLLSSFVLTICPGVGWLPAAVAAPTDDLKTAKDHFDFGEYGRALEILNPGIDAGKLPDPLLRDYLELRARCAVGLGQVGRAQDDYCRLHRLDPQWRPDPVNYTSDEMTAFESAVVGCVPAEPTPMAAAAEASRPFYKKPLTWLVAGAGAAAVLLLGGGGDEVLPPDSPLGNFPPPPGE